jgi:hypothetical protein
MDGSSKYFVQALEEAGVMDQESEREEYVVKEVITYRDEASGSEITVIPSEEYQVTTMVDFGTKVLGTQNATLEHISDFKDEISNARTFSFLHELEMLLENGLIKGGDLNNAIVYVDKEISDSTMKKLEKAFKKKKLSVKPNGILDNLTLNQPNEAARHKLLDVRSEGGADERYSVALERWLSLGGADLDARVGAVADQVGLPTRVLDQTVATLSGGQAARLQLAALLLSRFDVFLLDEPTNECFFPYLKQHLQLKAASLFPNF